jgi:hypothetical protein
MVVVAPVVTAEARESLTPRHALPDLDIACSNASSLSSSAASLFQVSAKAIRDLRTQDARPDVRSWHLADIPQLSVHVRF